MTMHGFPARAAGWVFAVPFLMVHTVTGAAAHVRRKAAKRAKTIEEDRMRRYAISMLLAWICFAAAGPGTLRAETYPSRPVTIIVPFAAGGPLDLIARAVGDKLSAELGQPFIVENKAGASGNLGTQLAARAKPDGYTLLVVLSSTLTANPALYKNLAFVPANDFRPLSLVGQASQMLVVTPSMPVNSLSDFVAYAKAHPITYAHAGFGSPGHLTMEYFALKAGFSATGVSYRGNAPLVTDLLGGQVQAGFVSTAGVIQHVLAGNLKGLAISAQKRTELAPDIPTASESNYPNFAVTTYFMMMAPEGVPDAIAALLENKVREALNAPDLRAKLRAQDITPVGSSAKEAEALLASETRLWAGVVEKANMQVQ